MFIQIYVLSRPGIGNNALFGKNRGAFVTGIPSIIMKPIANGLVSSPSTTQPTKGKKTPMGIMLCATLSPNGLMTMMIIPILLGDVFQLYVHGS